MNLIFNDKSILSYKKFGKGKKSLLLFHGFGQDSSVFHELVHALSDQYTSYCFDLFFHGNSYWNYGEDPIEKDTLKEFIERFLNQNEIENFSVLGFSMGSKFAMACTEAFPSRTKELILLAPDSIQLNFWYRMATNFYTTRKIFKRIINKPNVFFKAAHLAARITLINPKLWRFTLSQMDTVEKRNRVYYSWVMFRLLKFDIEKFIAQLMVQHTKLTVFVGSRDKVVQPKQVAILQKYIPGFKPNVLEAGHLGIIRACIPYLLSSQQTPNS
jgi:pimeloyl-ACP methyl ester carboxylesterase